MEILDEYALLRKSALPCVLLNKCALTLRIWYWHYHVCVVDFICHDVKFGTTVCVLLFTCQGIFIDSLPVMDPWKYGIDECEDSGIDLG